MGMKKIDITGEKYGRLAVIKEVEGNKYKRAYLCECDCGNEVIANMYTLRNGSTKSCGCLHKERHRQAMMNNIEGKRFGRLIAMEKTSKSDGNGSIIWKCQCDCGNKKEIASRKLTESMTKSCGCMRMEANEKMHEHNRKFDLVDGTYIPGLKMKVPSNNSSGYKGVYAYQRQSGVKYQVKIWLKGKAIHIGTFDTLEKAVEARKNAEKQYHHPYLYGY